MYTFTKLLVKLAFHDDDTYTDILVDIIARMSVSVSASASASWNSSFIVHEHGGKAKFGAKNEQKKTTAINSTA